MQITLNRVNESITGSVNGKPFGVTFTQERWDQMDALKKEANKAESMEELRAILDRFDPLTHEGYKDLIESKSPYLHVNNATNRFYLKYNKIVSKEPLPQAFVDRILEATEKGLDVKPLVKCWARFLRNPNYSGAKAQLFAYYINQKYTDPKMVAAFLKEGITHERAADMATTYQTPITEEGLIQTYKVSLEITKKFVKDTEAEDGVKEVLRDGHDYEVDEFTGLKKYITPKHVEDRIFEPAVMHSQGDVFQRSLLNGTWTGEGHIIKVGEVHFLKDWDMVNCDDKRAGVKGLHCGNLDYIRSYQTEGTVTHYVFVDPMHIGAIVQDNTGALRVKQYMVYASFTGVCRSLYHSSTYSALTDREYDALVAEVVAKTRDESIQAAQEAFDQKEALRGELEEKG